jgi:hypothetical protein
MRAAIFQRYRRAVFTTIKENILAEKFAIEQRPADLIRKSCRVPVIA